MFCVVAGLRRPLQRIRPAREFFELYVNDGFFTFMALAVEGKNKGWFPGSPCVCTRASAIFSSSGVTFLPFVISARFERLRVRAPSARVRIWRMRKSRRDSACERFRDQKHRELMRGSSLPFLYHEIQFIEKKRGFRRASECRFIRENCSRR